MLFKENCFIQRIPNDDTNLRVVNINQDGYVSEGDNFCLTPTIDAYLTGNKEADGYRCVSNDEIKKAMSPFSFLDVKVWYEDKELYTINDKIIIEWKKY